MAVDNAQTVNPLQALINKFSGNKPPVQQQNTQQQSNSQQQNKQEPNNMTNNQQQPTGDNDQQSNKPVNPLDYLANLGNNTPNEEAPKAPSFTLDKDGLSKAASSLDFTSGIDSELMQRATGGDAGALIELINIAGRKSYETAMTHTAALSDRFVNDRLEFDSNSLSSRVKNELTNSELSSIKGADNKLIKQQLTQIAQGLSKQYPEATPTEIAQASKAFLNEMLTATQDTPAPNVDANAPKEVDWSKHFGG